MRLSYQGRLLNSGSELEGQGISTGTEMILIFNENPETFINIEQPPVEAKKPEIIKEELAPYEILPIGKAGY